MVNGSRFLLVPPSVPMLRIGLAFTYSFLFVRGCIFGCAKRQSSNLDAVIEGEINSSVLKNMRQIMFIQGQ